MDTQIDRLSSLLERFSVRAHLFHTGPLCGVTHFDAEPGRGFLHVLRRGEMELSYRSMSGEQRRIIVNEPTLIFYPRPLSHSFTNAPREGADFTCATVDFDGGTEHPLARALPPLVLLPLDRVSGLAQSLDLLFGETDRVRCGHRLLADRLFEVVLLLLLRWMLDHPDDSDMPAGLMRGLADPKIARALVAIHDSPGKPWNLQLMAAQAHMSRSAFAARFREIVDETPADYLANWRMTIAQTRLREGRSVLNIANELGYGNASALSRIFTQRIGLSPRHWLNSVSLGTNVADA